MPYPTELPFHLVIDVTTMIGNWDRSVSIVSGKLGFDPQHRHSSEAYPASYPVGTEGKAWLWRSADHSPPSSSEVKNDQELYLLYLFVPAWQ